ncbi:MAG TPA: LacI family DNA-binding transcriptional regulator [Anaerolineaceae bacterium]|nr:LacI family DNA-binding transcriptional regulator [Anaerolineaceae bacterium]
MTTIRDVAKLAGVAPITVSRVINHNGYFTEETRGRVQNAIEQLGYVPNKLARSLRLRKTSMLALVLTDITNPFWTTVARGVEDAASDAGFNLILCNTDESDLKEEKYLKVLLERQVDGILLVPSTNQAEPILMAQRQGVQVVIIDRRLDGELFADVVRSDSFGGAYQLTRHLLALGHRRIVMLAGPRDVSTAEDRRAGFLKALEDARQPVTSQNVLYGEFTIESGHRQADQALNRSPGPTALFAANNFIAIGAYRAIRQKGLSVPEDVSLVGFDDLPSELVWEPFLTVAAQPAYEMGHRATEVLLDRMAEAAREAPQRNFEDIILPVETIVRKSTRACKPEN